MRRPHPLSLTLCAVAWLLGGLIGLAWGGVTAELEPRETRLGEAALLRVLVDGEAPATVDVSGLTDFTVTPRGKAVGTSGADRTVTAYRFELVARRAGNLLVPSLAVTLADGAVAHTPPLELRVRPQPAPPPNLADQDIALQAEVSTSEPVVGEPLRYTLRLFRSRTVASAAVTPPAFPGFTVEPLPGQHDDAITVAGRHYAVTEMEYLLTPRREGRAVLDPGSVVCRAVPGPGPGKTGRTLRCQSAPLTVTVHRRPEPTASPSQAPAVSAPVPPLELPATAVQDTAPPSRSLIVVLALAAPLLFLASRMRLGRGNRKNVPAPLGPTALAEALRVVLATRPGKQSPALAQALARLDRLLYAGAPADPADLEAAVLAARQALQENAP